MPKYLQKRRQGWYAVVEVPRPLREKMGKARFVESLQTDSLKVAEIRKHAIVGRWKAEIEAVRGTSSNLDRAVAARQRIDSTKKFDLQELVALNNIIMPQTDEEMSDLEKNRKDLSDVLHGKKFPLKQYLNDYEKTLNHIEKKSKDMRLSDIRRFLSKFKYADQATNREVKLWVEEHLIAEEGLAVTTCRRIMSNLRQYWKYLVDRKNLDQIEPFRYVVPDRTKTRKQEVSSRRRHFEPEHYRRLLDAAQQKQDDQLCSLIQLGAHTGCRIEELCSLKTNTVFEDRIEIEDAKTLSGRRTVPIHDTIANLVKTLSKNSKDEFLISGLSYNKYGDRSNAIGKRFGKLKSKCGYDRTYVFHSFRKGVATQLERLGISENVSANLLGHDIPTMTYGLYSGNKLDFQLLKETINKISWE